MACSDYTTAHGALADFTGTAPLDAVICPLTQDYGAGMGMLAFSLLVIAGIGLGYSIVHESPAPMVITALFAAPIFFFLLPGIAVNVIVMVIWFAIAIAIFILYQRASRAM